MTMRYMVEVEMKSGFSPMTERRVETAVWDAAPTTGAIRSVTVTAGKVEKVVCETELYGIAERKDGELLLIGYYTHRAGVVSTLKLIREHKVRGYNKKGEFVGMRYNPETSAWELLNI